MSDELEAARARIARLEQEAETNRAFFARSLSQANEPRRGVGPGLGHLVTLLAGIGVGVIIALALMVARGEPPSPVPLPPHKPQAPLAVKSPAYDAGTAPTPVPAPQADAGASAVAAAPPRARLDDRGTLNITATSRAIVFVDGSALGPAPIPGHVVRPGEHVVRVVCDSDAGLEAERKITVPPFAEVDVEHRCE